MVTNRDASDEEVRQVRIEDYFRSLSQEFNALKDRVRYLINDGHWQTDGEWKESVLRSVLQRTLPRNMVIGRGFIVDNRTSSSQIDILIYDSTYPILYKDGDLVFISPSSCRAIIEVKTQLSQARFRQAIEKLGSNAEIARSGANTRRTVFTGLFVYEETPIRHLLENLDNATDGNHKRIVDHISIGSSRFVKFWTRDPERRRSPYKQWHEYHLGQMAQGYFAHNLTTELAPDIEARRESVWFPESGKEGHLRQAQAFSGIIPMPRTFSQARRDRYIP